MGKWDVRFMRLAKEVAMWSKDPSTKVGAVIVDDLHRVVGLGYNGFPRGVEDKLELYMNKDTKYPRVVHAELNAILNLVSLSGTTIYVTLPPCPDCAGAIIQAGLKRVVIEQRINTPEKVSKWIEAFKISAEMFEQAGVKVAYV